MNPNGYDISSLYMDDGYLFFNVSPQEVNVHNDTIDLDINIDKKTVKNIIEWIDNNIPSYLFKLNTSLGINNLLGEK